MTNRNVSTALKTDETSSVTAISPSHSPNSSFPMAESLNLNQLAPGVLLLCMLFLLLQMMKQFNRLVEIVKK
ncbi:MAG: hypothetical protein H0X31_00190 [Nostocaceae cyanobacterium]|nr:hypothetical protein [Nostocaceae cyanobacterium]